jgi:hypothetical protein
VGGDALRWRVYYRGGRTVSSAEAAWTDLPADGALAVAWWERLAAGWRRHVEAGADAIVLDPDRLAIIGLNVPTSGPIRAACEAEARAGWLKWGALVPDAEWVAVSAAVNADRDLPDA